MAISLIELEHDTNKHRWVLWSKGNYIYEIENRKTGLQFLLNLPHSNDSLAEAREEFNQCVKTCGNNYLRQDVVSS
jgi:hypothetical protein